LDEVLAVGDDQFRLKCLDRVGRLLSSGVAGILVTHQTQNVERICTQCNVMSHGRTVLHTWDIAEAIELYRGLARNPVGDVEVIYTPGTPIRVAGAGFDGDSQTIKVQLTCGAEYRGNLFASYSASLNGGEVMRGTTRGKECLEVMGPEATFSARVPGELRRLGPLQLNMSLWDSETQSPLVWIKRIPVPASAEGSPEVVFLSASYSPV
jgi:energy-coupling factor transporter ATP-binding protein EcfA2